MLKQLKLLQLSRADMSKQRALSDIHQQLILKLLRIPQTESFYSSKSHTMLASH